MHVSAIIAAGGRGSRLGAAHPKQLLDLVGRSILQRSVEAFLSCDRIADVVVALPPEIVRAPPSYLTSRTKRLELVDGGERRQDSVARAFARVAPYADLVVVHDAARPFVTTDLIVRTIDAAIQVGAAIAALPAVDTVKRADRNGLVVGTLPRSEIYLAQTPQAFRTDVLRQALAAASLTEEATDEAALAEQAGHAVHLVAGDPRNVKITTADDFESAARALQSVPVMRIGNGYDLHRLVAGRPLVLGGVTIPFEKGLEGHSDADAVCHAMTDAILGAASAGDIGRHFPDTDPEWRNANSLALLTRASQIVMGKGYRIVNIDVVVIAERPRLLPHLDAMVANLSAALDLAPDQLSVKGKTNERADSMGAGESIAVHAVALLNRVGGHV